MSQWTQRAFKRRLRNYASGSGSCAGLPWSDLSLLGSIEIFHFIKFADFDDRRPGHGIGAPLHPLDRFIEVMHLPDPIAGDEIVDVGKRSFGHRTISTGEGDARALGARPQAGRVDQDSSVPQLIVESSHLLEKFRGRQPPILALVGRCDVHHNAHRALLLRTCPRPPPTLPPLLGAEAAKSRQGYRFGATSANSAPCGSTPLMIQLPPGTCTGPWTTCPPADFTRSSAASAASTVM